MELDATVRIVEVNLGERSYRAYISRGLLRRLGKLIAEELPNLAGCAVITSEPLRRLFGDRIAESLEDAGVDFEFVLVPDGEGSKTWEEAGRALGLLIDLRLERGSAIIALGGGSIGDLSAFISSIYLRGVRHVQVPTTLLSQVDSCIGGKAAVNHPKGKNLVGAYHQPSLTAVDPTLLETLPREELASGAGEVIKYGVVADPELFEALESTPEGLLERRMPFLEDVIFRCLTIKARIIELDERDTRGYRATLNYGHTVGHAIEHLTGMRHGMAVALGMEAEAGISRSLGLLTREDEERIIGLIGALGLRGRPPRLEPSRVLEAMRRDKKVEGGSIRLVLPTEIGRPPALVKVSAEEITRELEARFHA